MVILLLKEKQEFLQTTTVVREKGRKKVEKERLEVQGEKKKGVVADSKGCLDCVRWPFKEWVWVTTIMEHQT